MRDLCLEALAVAHHGAEDRVPFVGVEFAGIEPVRCGQIAFQLLQRGHVVAPPHGALRGLIRPIAIAKVFASACPVGPIGDLSEGIQRFDLTVNLLDIGPGIPASLPKRSSAHRSAI